MWMTNPLIQCDKHLKGEYVECLMFIGTFKRKLNIKGYIEKNLVEPLSIIERFDLIKAEMLRRGFNAVKELDFDICLLDYLNPDYIRNVIDGHSSFVDLITRCPVCYARNQFFLENENIFPKRDYEFTDLKYSRQSWQDSLKK
jgi:hypothetical protein